MTQTVRGIIHQPGIQLYGENITLAVKHLYYRV